MYEDVYTEFIMNNVVRINITIPKETLKKAKKIAPSGNVSRLVTSTLEDEIRRREQREAFEEIKQMPPAFSQIKNAQSWIRNLRKENEKRMRRLGI